MLRNFKFNDWNLAICHIVSRTYFPILLHAYRNLSYYNASHSYYS